MIISLNLTAEGGSAISKGGGKLMPLASVAEDQVLFIFEEPLVGGVYRYLRYLIRQFCESAFVSVLKGQIPNSGDVFSATDAQDGRQPKDNQGTNCR